MDVTLHASFQNGGPADKDIYVPVLMSLNTEARLLYDEGSNLLQAQKYIEALPKLEAAAKLSPDNDESLNNFAVGAGGDCDNHEVGAGSPGRSNLRKRR
jgi:hypothetical protein